MPSSYTPNLRLTLPLTGENSGTWGDLVNTGITALMDASVAGTAAVTMTAADKTLSAANGATDEARQMFVVLTGTPGASYNVIVPTSSKLYFVQNATGFAQTVKTVAGTGISVPNGTIKALYCNGTNVVDAITALGAITTVDINGGTVDGTPIGSTTPAAGSFTTLSATGNASASAFTGSSLALTSYMDSAQANGIVVRGNTGTPANQTEIWNTGSSKCVLSSTGLAVTGGLSATSNVSMTSANPALLFNTSSFQVYKLNNDIRVYTEGADRAVFNASGLAVTGSLSATGGSVGDLTLNGGVAAPDGAIIRMKKGGVDKGFITHQSTLVGDSSNNIGIYPVAGANAVLCANGSTTPTAVASSTGLALTGSLNATKTTADSVATLINTDTANGSGLYVKGGGVNAGKYALYVENGAGAQVLHLDASGNLGLGATPNAWPTNSKAIVMSHSNGMSTAPGGDFQIQNNAYLNGSAAWTYNTSSVGASRYQQNFGTHAWYTAPSGTAGQPISFTQAMTLDVSGNLLVGTTTGTLGSANFGAKVGADGAFVAARNVNGASAVAQFYGNAGEFRVYGSGNAVNTNNSYGAISDLKLKENIVDATPKLAKLLQVRIVNYNLKTDPTHKQIGVIAQELEQVIPGMVEESPARDKDGTDLGTTTKSVKYSVFVPMLIKAMQEQQAIIESLQSRITALEGI